jgi:hypothetical protein
MKRQLSADEIGSLSLGDANLVGLGWNVPTTGEVTTPELSVTLVLGNGNALILVFEWAMSVRVELDYRDVFSLLSWEVTFKPIDDDRWRVSFDFARSGSISFECNKVYVQDG